MAKGNAKAAKGADLKTKKEISKAVKAEKKVSSHVVLNVMTAPDGSLF